MQGQRGMIGSLPETLEFDHESTSGNAIMNQPICWNSMRNPAENRLADFMLPPSHVNTTYVNSVDQERQNSSNWSIGEPSSSGEQNEICRDEQNIEHVWASSASNCTGAGPRLEERQYESGNIISLENVNVNPQSVQSSNSNAIPQNINLTAGFVSPGIDNCQDMGGPNVYKSSGTGNNGILPASESDTLFSSGSRGYAAEANNGRPGCSLDGYRQSCKRKAVELNIGESSRGESSSFFQHSESTWSGVPTHCDTGSGLRISDPSEQANASLALGVRGLASESIPDSGVVVHGQNSRRNFRLRMNPSNQEQAPPSFFPLSGVVRHSGVPSSHQSSRLRSVDHSLNLSTPSEEESTTSQNQPVGIPVPALPQNWQTLRWNEGSSSRAGSSSTSVNLGDRGETSTRNLPRNLWQHPMALPATELRTLARNPAIRSINGGNISIHGNVASTSRTGASSSVHSISAPTLVPQPNFPSRYSRRMAEYVRRSLFSANGVESGGQNSVQVQSGPSTSSEEMALSSGRSNQGHNRSYPRLSSWMERHGDSVPGIPYPFGRSRLVMSEIRNVLDLMRRGENLRAEDVMILDQSVFFGMADVHDRHRDMRLDVDNMSYEELLALEERIGNVSTGLSEETIVDRLKHRKYLTAAGAEAEAEPCCVCQEEYNDGEDLGTLDCGHDFHSHCIKEWLKHKNLCPICKTTGLAT